MHFCSSRCADNDSKAGSTSSELYWNRIEDAEVNSKVAGFLFIAICVVLAVLLLTRTIGIITSGAVFAIVLALLGGRAAQIRSWGRAE